MSWALWLTGRPGSGKTTLARSLAAELEERREPGVVLELDAIRRTLTPEPTYSDPEREVVYRALVYLTKLLTDAGIPVIIDATGHQRAWRDLARAVISSFAEVQLVCPFEVCQERERTRIGGHAPRGIYATAGKPSATVPGVNVAYEPALAPEAVVDTTVLDPATAAAELVPLARALGQAAPAARPRTGAGWALWITGLPGSGKTTLAWGVADALATRDVAVTVLDLADVREFLLPAATPTPAQEEIIHRTLVYAAKLLTSLGIPVVIDAAAPRRRWRQMAREIIANYAEVQLVCPSEVCEQRARAVRWNPLLCPHGRRTPAPAAETVDAALGYEASLNPELIVHTDVRDVGCVTEEIFQLAYRLHRTALTQSVTRKWRAPCRSAT